MIRREGKVRTGPLMTGTVEDVIEARRRMKAPPITPDMLGNVAWQMILEEAVKNVRDSMLRNDHRGETDELYGVLADAAATAMGWMDVLRPGLSRGGGMVLRNPLEGNQAVEERMVKELNRMFKAAIDGETEGGAGVIARMIRLANEAEARRAGEDWPAEADTDTDDAGPAGTTGG